MAVRNCSRCGRMYQSEGLSKLCARCMDTDEEDFKIVREYVYDNPSCTISAAAEDTGISEEKILKFLRQGKLILKDEMSMVLDCERCGKPIKSGRYCDSCNKDMSRDLRGAASKTAESIQQQTAATTGGMYSRASERKK